MEPSRTILTLNVGSSSLKYALYDFVKAPVRRAGGTFDRLNEDISAGDLLDRLTQSPDLKGGGIGGVSAIGHRVVHGLDHPGPAEVTEALLTELRGIAPVDPDHMPREIELMEECRRRFPDVPQVACFDTSFHRSMPDVARRLPLPRKYDAEGIRRYGFHGLSYAYLIQALGHLGDPAATSGRVVLAHLGSGASLAAVRNGVGVDTTMAFTPAAGLVMGTRTGDLDPGVFPFLATRNGMDAAGFQRLVNRESGLLGVSETSSDMRDLLAREGTDERAAQAVALFCYSVRKGIGAYAAALGGLDTLVFAGGIGENSPAVRARICDGLEFLGISIDDAANAANAAELTKSRPSVRVIATDEEMMIARLTAGIANFTA